MSTSSSKENGGMATSTRKRSVSHPRYNLRQVEDLAKSVFEMGPRNCDQDRVAQKAGYKNASNGAFIGLKASASQFGLIEAKGAYISVTQYWIDVFHREGDELRVLARQNAMQEPTLYKQLLEEYLGHQLPTLEKLERELYIREKYGILRDAALQAAQVFVESASFAGMLDPGTNRLQADRYEKEISNQRHVDPQPSTNVDWPLVSNPAQPVTVHSSQQTTLTRNVLPLTGNDSYDELDRIEVRLVNGKKAYLFVPVPLPHGEKERLKRHIDLLLEEAPVEQRTDE